MRPDLQLAIDSRDTDLFGAAAEPKPGVPLHPDSIERGLQEAWARRELAERLRADAMAELDAWVRAALDAGWEVTRIAELGGISRQTIYARRE